MTAGTSVLALPERRNATSRAEVLQRIRAEFQEMPCMRLTCAQAQRLFGLPHGAAERVLGSLVAERTLARGPDGRYALRDDAPRVTRMDPSRAALARDREAWLQRL